MHCAGERVSIREWIAGGEDKVRISVDAEADLGGNAQASQGFFPF